MTALALVLALQAGAAATAPYDTLLERAVTRGRAGDLAGAEEALRQAIRLDPRRAEARIELGGVRFLQRRYEEGARELRAALRLREDAYARDLLATSLHLAGRVEEALDHWNRLRRPVLRNIHVRGQHHTRSRLVVPALDFREGLLLTREQVERTSLLLRETGAFHRVRVRPLPLPGGEADVEVALVERHGLGSPLELLARTTAKALQRTAWLRYENLDGAGVALGASYRWERTQPRVAAAIDWARPLGLGVRLRAEGAWERPQYQLGDVRLTMRARGAEVGLRRVLDARTVGEVRWRGRRRSFSTAHPDAREGLVSGLEAVVERRLADAGRFRARAELQAFASSGLLGSEVGFVTGRATAAATLALPGGGGGAAPRSELAGRLVVGRGSEGTPLDAMFAPGAGSEMDYPLRGHRQKHAGVLGRAPIGRSLTLLNVEYRRGWARLGPAEVGTVLFWDGARIAGTTSRTGVRFFHDVGVGLRLEMADLVVRVDYGRGLAGPRSQAVTAGLGHVF